MSILKIHCECDYDILKCYYLPYDDKWNRYLIYLISYWVHMQRG